MWDDSKAFFYITTLMFFFFFLTTKSRNINIRHSLHTNKECWALLGTIKLVHLAWTWSLVSKHTKAYQSFKIYRPLNAANLPLVSVYIAYIVWCLEKSGKKKKIFGFISRATASVILHVHSYRLLAISMQFTILMVHLVNPLTPVVTKSQHTE